MPEPYGSDFIAIGMTPSVDMRPKGKGTKIDEWGTVWENLGICNCGEVKEHPLKVWDKFNDLKIPDAKGVKMVIGRKYCRIWQCNILVAMRDDNIILFGETAMGSAAKQPVKE